MNKEYPLLDNDMVDSRSVTSSSKFVMFGVDAFRVGIFAARSISHVEFDAAVKAIPPCCYDDFVKGFDEGVLGLGQVIHYTRGFPGTKFLRFVKTTPPEHPPVKEFEAWKTSCKP